MGRIPFYIFGHGNRYRNIFLIVPADDYNKASRQRETLTSSDDFLNTLSSKFTWLLHFQVLTPFDLFSLDLNVLKLLLCCVKNKENQAIKVKWNYKQFCRL